MIYPERVKILTRLVLLDLWFLFQEDLQLSGK